MTTSSQPTSSPNLAKDELELSLYENAIDSIRHAIEHYSSDLVESRRYKYALLHIAQGVTLLLKERLSRVHPNFIFTNVADGEKTVDVDQALVRLEKIAHVKLDTAKDLIQELARLRNKIEHFAATINKRQAASIIARVVVFLDSFFRNELQKEFRLEIGEANWRALLSIEEYLGHAKQEVEIRLKADYAPTYFCDVCQSYTATLTNRRPTEPDMWVTNYSEVTCLVCLRRITYREECRGCRKEMLFQDSAALAWRSYCDECKAKFREEYPGFLNPEFVAEVQRWFQVNKTITTEQLVQLLFNVALYGSSRYNYLNQLVEKGVIDFVYDEERKVYRSGIVSGVRPHDTFNWVYDPARM